MTSLVTIGAAEAQYSDEWDPYQILGIRRRSSVEKIRAAYRRLAKSLHSDAGGDAAAFLLLKEAHDFLLDPSAKALWDRKQVRSTEQECKKARGLLDQICNSVVARVASGGQLPPEHADIPNLMRQVICSQLDDFASSQNDARKKLGRLKLMKGKTRRKGRGENIVARVIETSIADLERVIDSLANEIRVADVMLAELETYECDPPPQQTWTEPSFTNATTPAFTVRFF